MRKLKELWPWLLCLAFWLLAIVAFVSCTTGKAVVVPEVRQTVVHERDTVTIKDSVRESSTTIIQQADSALMAEFGIRLDNMEHAWLVRQTDSKATVSNATFVVRKDSVVHDSIPVPYPKEVYKDRKLSRWQSIKMALGDALIMLIIAYIGLFIIEKISKKIL